MGHRSREEPNQEAPKTRYGFLQACGNSIDLHISAFQFCSKASDDPVYEIPDFLIAPKPKPAKSPSSPLRKPLYLDVAETPTLGPGHKCANMKQDDARIPFHTSQASSDITVATAPHTQQVVELSHAINLHRPKELIFLLLFHHGLMHRQEYQAFG